MENQNLTVSPEEVKLPSAEALLEAGVHFGHKKSRWHPKMEPYIFASRNNIHIFDLEKTLEKLAQAIAFMQTILVNGGTILFVGTKPAGKKIVQETAESLKQPYVSRRWLGGTITNFKTIAKRLEYYRNLEEQKKTGEWEKYTKKERLQLQKKLDKLEAQFSGIKNLARVPEALLVADIKADGIAVHEAKKTKIPVVAICDTNNDPSDIDYPIPANDDATSSLKIILETISQNLKDIKSAPKLAKKPEPIGEADKKQI